MKKLALLLGLASIVLTGCVGSSSPAPTDQPASGVEEKQGDRTLTGYVRRTQGGTYHLATTLAVIIPIDSYSVDLAQYVDKEVTITGQYSGDTLFVGSIE